MCKEKVNRLRVRRELDLISRTYTVEPNTSSSGKQLSFALFLLYNAKWERLYMINN